MKLYHYTKTDHLLLILKGGIKTELGFTKQEMLDSWLVSNPKGRAKREVIRNATLLAKEFKGCLPAVWLTTCPFFEKSAFACHCSEALYNISALKLMISKGLSEQLVRIEVDIDDAIEASIPNLRSVLNRNQSNINSLDLGKYESHKWHFVTKTIPVSSITSVSVIHDNRWLKIKG